MPAAVGCRAGKYSDTEIIMPQVESRAGQPRTAAHKFWEVTVRTAPVAYENYERAAIRDLRREFDDEDSAAAAIDDVLEPRWRQ
jgi:hypothetical protein